MPRRSGLIFVVQKHRARALHYDLRLEIGGVMPSWSVPKGPSLDPSVKRLAMATSDHELDYARFEGTLPGEYGAGVVMIWDKGTYNPEEEVEKGSWKQVGDRAQANQVAAQGYRSGELKFTLYGKKLGGSFALVKTHGFMGSNSWLLIKHRDKFAKSGYDANDYDFSAVSGRAMAEIAGPTDGPLDSFK